MAVSILVTEFKLCISNEELTVLPNLMLAGVPRSTVFGPQHACGRRVCSSRFVHVVRLLP